MNQSITAAIKKKPKKKAPRKAPPQHAVRGFDYGCLPSALAVGSIDFADRLTAASVDGVAYGFARSEAVGLEVPAISLACRYGTELAKAFDTFTAWSNLTDADSLEITFVFRKNGSYVLALSAEPSRLARRCLAFDRSHRPLTFASMWIKVMDSVKPFLFDFRKYCAAPIAPFLLAGVVYDQFAGLSASSPPDIRPIPGLQPLLKFEATFVDEDNVTPHTSGWIALKRASASSPEAPSEPPQSDPKEVARLRAATLRCHFPLTLERFRRATGVQQMKLQLEGEGVSTWQIEQALCNLVLSTDMGRATHYAGLTAKQAQKHIIKALRSRFEIASGATLPPFTVDEIRTQVVADGNALLRFRGNRPVSNSAALQTALRQLSLLDAPTTVGDA